MTPSLEALLKTNPIEAAKLMQKELLWWSKNKIKTFYPETGPLRRELYVKHMQFFEAGAKHRTRGCVAANRCVTPWTPVEMGRATRQCREVVSLKTFDVRSWDGGSRCTKQASGVFVKGIERAFRIHLDNGQFFDATRRHRVLTIEGYLSIAQLTRRANGLHCWHTGQDYLANYGTDDYPDGRLLQPVSDSGLTRFPSRVDVLSSSRRMLLVGAMETRFEYTRAYQESVHYSNLDDQSQIVALCDQFEDPADYIDAVWPKCLVQELRQFAHELNQRQPAVEQDRLEPSSCKKRSQIECPGGHNNCGRHQALGRSSERLAIERDLGPVSEEFLYEALGTAIFLPLEMPPLVGGNKIISIVPLGLQPILDFTVESTHCYESGGVIHSNTGKTEGIGAFEVTAHVTGEYPSWWKGHRFNQANNWWVAGDTNQTTRDILQAKLLGKIVREKGDDASKPAGLGTGMLPAALIKATRAKAGSIPNAVETVWVKHITGGISSIVFKSYEQGREAFQGTEMEGVWLDEEPDEGIFNECLIRTMPTGAFKGGICLLTFTPLSGWSDVVAKFLDPEECLKSNRFVIQMGWDDAPHLSEQAKSVMLAELPPHQRDARTKGIPQLGSGAIYPIGESEISSAVFEIPPHWPRVYGMDVGWNRTAAIWGAWNREADIVYLYEQHYFAHSEPGENARAIKARGAWIPGVIDPASRGRSQVDGTQLIEQYQNLGLELSFAVNAVDSGIYDVWERMVSGRLKVFVSLADFWKEYRVYRRDEKGKIVKKADHLMDSMRYLVKSGLDVAKQKPVFKPADQQFLNGRDFGSGWLG